MNSQKTILFVLPFLLIASCAKNGLLKHPKEDINLDCKIACMFVFDLSGSMNNPIETGSSVTKIKALQEATKGFIDLLPLSYWQTGIMGTFSDHTELYWDLGQLDTEDKRTHLKSAIDNMEAQGGTNLTLGITAGATKLIEQDLPRFLILFTDGEVEDPEELRSVAEYVSLPGGGDIKIVTVGVNLGTAEETLLREIAMHPDASINSTNPADLSNFFTNELANICDWIPDLSFSPPQIEPPTILMGRVPSDPNAEGMMQFTYTLTHESDKAIDVNFQLEAEGVPNSNYLFSPSTGIIGPSNPKIEYGKFQVTTRSSTPPGSYEINSTVNHSPSGATLCSEIIPFTIIDVTPTVSDIEFKGWHIDRDDEKIYLFKWRVNVPTPSNVDVTFSGVTNPSDRCYVLFQPHVVNFHGDYESEFRVYIKKSLLAENGGEAPITVTTWMRAIGVSIKRSYSFIAHSTDGS